MLGNKASRYETPSPTQSWLNLSAWAGLSVVGMASLARKDWLHQWLAGGKAVHETQLPAPDVPAASPSVPDLLPFPLELPSPEQIGAWREQLLYWGPIVAVWALLGVAVLGTVWLVLTLMLRLLVWRPRTAGGFRFTEAQELATQTLLALVAVAILGSSYFVPTDYLTGVIPFGIFVGFCAAVPGEKGWYTWGRLFGEWRDELRWYRRSGHHHIPYDPPPREAAAAPAVTDPHMLRLRKKLEKIEAQVNHASTHPGQREAARRARNTLIETITALEDKMK